MAYPFASLHAFLRSFLLILRLLPVGAFLLLTQSLSACDEGDITVLPEAGGLSTTLLAGDRFGNLHSVDPATGASQALPALTYDDSAVGPISSMAYLPSLGRLLAGHGGSSTCRGCIYLIGPAGTATFLADNSVVNAQYTAAAGMAVRPDGVVFVEYEGGENLASLDPMTGVATPIGSFYSFPFAGCCGYGMVYTGGALYLGNEFGLYTVDTTTAQATLVGNWTYPNIAAFQAIDPSFPNDPKIASMDRHPRSGVIYATLNDSFSGTQFRYLVTVNLATAAVALVGEINSELDGLVFIY